MNNKAFTLAEILITLGVIGVVAAITLSIIINKTQKFVLKQQFKRTYSIVSQAMEKARADLEYYPVCSYITGAGAAKNADCIEFKNALLNNLKIIKKCDNHAFQNGCIADIKGLDSPIGLKDASIKNRNLAIFLSNESILMFYGDGSTPIYLLDTNGLKGPNKWGYDIFGLYIINNKLGCYVSYTEAGGMKCSDLLINK